MRDCAHFQNGTNIDVAFVFSCPGKEEEDCSLPASGQTGENLGVLIEFLIENHILNAGSSKADFRITNAWDRVLYADNNEEGRTEASLSRAEILSDDSLDRLFNELRDIQELIICFGLRAYKAVTRIESKLSYNVKIIKSTHLSFQFLNRNIKLDLSIGTPGARNKQRIKAVADTIVSNHS